MHKAKADNHQAGTVLIEETEGAVRILRMNRPDKLNALNTELTTALHDGLLAADKDPSIRAIVLTGEGRGFCAGGDLSEFKHFTPNNQDAVVRRAHLTAACQSLPQTISKPIVSAVRGVAAGGGAGLAIACDMMVAGTDLRLFYPEVKHSIVPAIVMTGLQRQLGRKTAFELISTEKVVDAQEAQRLGLANRVVKPDQVVAAALEIANGWAKVHPVAMAATKNLFYRVADLPFEAAMAAGRDVNGLMRGFKGTSA